MTANSITLAGRRAAEALMVDTCTITHPSSTSTFNATTGTSTPDAGTQVYSGACRVKPRDNADRVVQFGEQATTLLPYVVSIPMSATGVAVDDTIAITASALDPSLVGVRLRVREAISGTHITARRLSCEVDAG